MEVIQSLGKYEIHGTLGRGAMGTVLDGLDPVIGRRVAIKTVRLPEQPDDAASEEIARFRREAQAAGRLNHPNIVAVYDYGETGDLAFIVMEFVDGPTLKTLLDKGERFAPADAARVMQGLLAGLGFSHARGVVHRDIKPGNVMLTAGGDIKIADFGIARIESSSMTQAGTMLGTPAYMSPEQFRGEVVDARTDLYSAGVLLYQLLTGERPFDGGLTAIMHKVLTTEPPPPSALAGGAARFDAVVARAMAKRPEDRFPDAAAFAEAIRAASVTPTEAGAEATMIVAPSPRPRPSVPAAVEPARSRPKLPLVLGILVLLGAAAGGALWGLRPVPAPLPPKSEPAPAVAKPVEPPAPAPAVVSPAPAPIPSPPAGLPTIPVDPAPVVPSPPVPTPALRPPQSPSRTAAAPPIPASKLARVTEALAATHCTLATARGQDGAIKVSGLSGPSAAEALRRAVGGMVPAWRLQAVDPVFCGAFEALRPIAPLAGQPNDGLRLDLDGGRTTLRDGERIMPRLRMADFAGALRVDYFAHDGSLVHLYPPPDTAGPAPRLAAGSSLALGDPGPGRPDWLVGPPYGTDILIAVASSAPLNLPKRPAAETGQETEAYVRALGAAIAAARHDGTEVTAAVLPVETLPAKN